MRDNMSPTLVHILTMALLFETLCFVSWNRYQIATPSMIQVHFAFIFSFEYEECFKVNMNFSSTFVKDGKD